MSDRRIPFTAEDEDRIASASLWGIIAAVTGMLSGAANLVLTIVGRTSLAPLVGYGVALLISLLLGIWLIQACTAFRAVARTDVADKAYLLRGFDKLHTYFLTTGVLMIIGLVLVALGFLAVLVLPKGLRIPLSF